MQEQQRHTFFEVKDYCREQVAPATFIGDQTVKQICNGQCKFNRPCYFPEIENLRYYALETKWARFKLSMVIRVDTIHGWQYAEMTDRGPSAMRKFIETKRDHNTGNITDEQSLTEEEVYNIVTSYGSELTDQMLFHMRPGHIEIYWKKVSPSGW